LWITSNSKIFYALWTVGTLFQGKYAAIGKEIDKVVVIELKAKIGLFLLQAIKISICAERGIE